MIPPEWPEERSFVFEQPGLVVNTVSISCKVSPEAYAGLNQAHAVKNERRAGAQ